MSDITPEMKQAIRNDKQAGMPYKDLLKKYKISPKMLKLMMVENEIGADMSQVMQPNAILDDVKYNPCLDLAEKPDMSLPGRTDNKLNSWVDDYRNPTGFKRV